MWAFLIGNWLGIAMGLVVGWWLLPQPSFMKRLYEKITG